MTPFQYRREYFPVGSALLAALIACVIYLLTVDSSVSYWDCPEYVATASSLQIGHPPGNPIWTLTMRMATIPFSAEHHARVINICSGILMALAVFFLARITYYFIYYVLSNSRKAISPVPPDSIMTWSALASAMVAVCFAVLDSTWFSAVEAEVYAFSTFLTAFTIWLMLRWARARTQSMRYRWLILIAYILGLSLGVHQLNLLCLPVLALIFVFRRNPERPVTARAWLAVALSFLLTGSILLLFMPGTIASAAFLEHLTVNRLRLPYFTGVLLYPILTIICFIVAIRLTRSRPTLKVAVWMVGMLWLGYSAVGFQLIRGYAATPINEAAPTDIFSLQRYIAREQYGSKPLFYGATPYSRPVLLEEWQQNKDLPDYSRYLLHKEAPRYVMTLPQAHIVNRSRMLTHTDSLDNRTVAEHNHGYLISDYRFSRVTTPELNMWFPRITSSAMLSDYKDWAGMTSDNMVKVDISTAIDSTGKYVGKLTPGGEREKNSSLRPTYLQNLRFFISYQVTYMYLRYLLWNFVGRQNDLPSIGEIDHGNFITGIAPLDDLMLGDQSLMPHSASYDNPGRHAYFGIPFLIGILGMVFLMKRGRPGKRVMAIVTMLFLMTGLAIVVYLNQDPGQPRERDYAFLGSYMAFCIWIAFGLIYIAITVRRLLKSVSNATLLLSAIGTALFLLFLIENYPDHNRSGRYHTRAFALNMLAGKDRDIIISYGDNFTFPLWYVQEVEKAAPEATIVDLSYLATPEYVVNLMKQGKKGVKLTATAADIAYGAYAFTRIAPDADTVPLPLIDILQELYAAKEGNPVLRHSKAFLPGKTLSDTLTLNLRSLATTSGMIPFRTLMMLDIIATNLRQPSPRPISFLTHVKREVVEPVKDATFPEAFSDTYAPGMTRDEYFNRLMTSATAVDSTSRSHKFHTPYTDPVIDDQVRRQRGSLVRVADILLQNGERERARDLLLRFPLLFPATSPGSFTVADTTFHETLKAAALLLGRGDTIAAAKAKELLERSGVEPVAWNRFYRSLPAWRHSTVSNSSRRLITTLPVIDSLMREANHILDTKATSNIPDNMDE